MTRTLALLSTALFLVSCGGGEKTPAELIVGEWEFDGPVTVGQGAEAVSMSDSEMEYKADGTSEGEIVMKLMAAPEDSDEYKIEATGTYRIEGNTLYETITGASVTPLDSGAQVQQIAGMLKTGMMSAGEQTQEIVSVDKGTLVLRDNATGVETTYSRD